MELQRALQASLHEQMLQKSTDRVEEDQDQADLKMAIQLSLGGMPTSKNTPEAMLDYQQPCSSRSLIQQPPESRHSEQSPVRNTDLCSQSSYYRSETSSSYSYSTTTYNSIAQQQETMEIDGEDLVERIHNKAEAIEQMLNEWDEQGKED